MSKWRYAVSLCLTIIGLSLFCFKPQPVFAQSQPLNLWSDIFSLEGVGFNAFLDIGLGTKDPRVIAAGVVRIMLGFLGVLAVVLIIYAGFLWSFSQGDPKKIATAQGVLKSAVIGLLIVLSAFALATYIIKVWLGVTGADSRNPLVSSGGSGGSNLGALGSGIVRSVYPEPGQRNVPRNTSIMITFKEMIKPESLCAEVSNGKCAAGSALLTDNVQIIAAQKLMDDQPIRYQSAKVASVDNLTFVITPDNYLGSPDGFTWYNVVLTGGIKKANGSAAFGLGDFKWSFEVSNVLDLDPPQVVAGELFPAPDNQADQTGQLSGAIAAKASIILKDQPQAGSPKLVSYQKLNPNSVEIDVLEPQNTCDGQLTIVINNTNPLTANLNYNGMAGRVNEPSVAIVDEQIATACGFKVKLSSGVQAGHAWRLSLAVSRAADWLQVAGVRYTFVKTAKNAGDIVIGSDLAATKSALVKAINDSGRVVAAVQDERLLLTAKLSGAAGNRLDLESSISALNIILFPFAGGTDAIKRVTVKDRPDQPKNAIIQLTFNEAMNPAQLSGSSDDVGRYLRVVNLADNQPVKGFFRLTNQYRTVEFIPDQQCGTNGCGEPVFCLPANSQLRVELVAAQLTAVCGAAADCSGKAPYEKCSQSLCSLENGTAYPEGLVGSGITDAAANSLDGNRDQRAEGPLAFFDENTPDAKLGDNFRWSFWIGAESNITPPRINGIEPDNQALAVSLNQPVKIVFDKLMLSSSLAPGYVTQRLDGQAINHQLLNLRALDGSGVGYWITKESLDTTQPADGYADLTIAIINHQPLAQSTKYRAQVGSGVKDIYQNCYKPCSGLACSAGGSQSSCCLGLPTDLGSASTCP